MLLKPRIPYRIFLNLIYSACVIFNNSLCLNIMLNFMLNFPWPLCTFHLLIGSRLLQNITPIANIILGITESFLVRVASSKNVHYHPENRERTKCSERKKQDCHCLQMIWFCTLNSTGIYREIGRINRSLGSCSQDKILTYRRQFYSIYQQQIYKMKISRAVVAKYEVPRIKRSLIGKKKKYYWDILRKFLLKGKVHHYPFNHILYYRKEVKSKSAMQS